jgi:D-glycero-D-manno-heptose 1,7-bisphosphate phosphatase
VNGRAGVIVDRDATLIDVVRDEETGAISVAFHPSQIVLLPGVLDGMRALSARFALSIATNQPAPAKGQFSAESVARTNAALVELFEREGVPIASLEVCLHHPVGGPGGDPALIGPCECRKPAPGLLLKAIAHAALDPKESWMIGDSASDVEAARRAGVRAALVFPENRCELCPLRGGPSVTPDVVAPCFDELAHKILAQR